MNYDGFYNVVSTYGVGAFGENVSNAGLPFRFGLRYRSEVIVRRNAGLVILLHFIRLLFGTHSTDEIILCHSACRVTRARSAETYRRGERGG